MAKKSFYIFLCGLLGVFLFLILDRTVIFIYLYLVSGSYLATGFNYVNFLFWDDFTLTLALMLGAWYGIWLGMNWYEMVYVQRTHGGLVDHIARHYWLGRRPAGFDVKVAHVKERLEKDLSQLEGLASLNLMPKQNEPEPRIRRVARKKAPKKTSLPK